jgi:uncharacterized protein YneF (UPF0154 family)
MIALLWVSIGFLAGMVAGLWFAGKVTGKAVAESLRRLKQI